MIPRHPLARDRATAIAHQNPVGDRRRSQQYPQKKMTIMCFALRSRRASWTLSTISERYALLCASANEIQAFNRD